MQALLPLLFLLLVTYPIVCLGRFTCAIFSPAISRSIRKHWIIHAMLVVSSICSVAVISRVGEIMTMNKGGKLQNEVETIRTGIISYETEYSEPPPTSANAELIKILMGKNQRGIQFISVKSDDLNSKGEMVDPWKEPFQISLADPDHPVITSKTLQDFAAKSHQHDFPVILDTK